MDELIAQLLADLLAESVDDANFFNLINEHEQELAPKRVPLGAAQDHVQHLVDAAMKKFASDPGVRELLRDGLMKALSGWYEEHEGLGT